MRSFAENNLGKTGVAGGIVAANRTFPGVMAKIVEPWYKCAQAQECITPTGASLSNHRYDQAALGVILYANGFTPANSGMQYFDIQMDIG